MSPTPPSPPYWAECLLETLLKAELAEEILGDLEERFQEDAEKRGLRRARRHYWYQTLNYLSNARKITSSFCVEISFAGKEEKPSLAGQMRLFLTQYAGRESQIPSIGNRVKSGTNFLSVTEVWKASSQVFCVLIAIISYILDNQKQRRKDKRQLTLEYLKKIIHEDGPMLEANEKVALWRVENRTFENDLVANFEDEKTIIRILNFYDLIADSAQKKIIDEEMIVTHLGGRMKGAYLLFEGYIQERRKRLKRPRLYAPLESFISALNDREL